MNCISCRPSAVVLNLHRLTPATGIGDVLEQPVGNVAATGFVLLHAEVDVGRSCALSLGLQVGLLHLDDGEYFRHLALGDTAQVPTNLSTIGFSCSTAHRIVS